MFGRSKRDGKGRGNQRRGDGRGQLLKVNGRAGDKSRERAHKIGALVVLILAVGGVGWAAVVGFEVMGRAFFSENEHFTIRTLDVQSNGRLQPEHLREYGKVAEGQNLFALDIAQIRANLESVPLIRSAEIKRDLPDTLIIRVTERSALGRLADGAGGHPVLVDRDGYVLGLGRSSTLPLIRGASERGLGPGSVVREKNILDALDVLDLCDATRLGSVIHVDVIEANATDRLVLRLSGGEIIPMGRDQLKERLEKLVDVLKTAQEMGQAIQTADLTVLRNVPVVYRKP